MNRYPHVIAIIIPVIFLAGILFFPLIRHGDPKPPKVIFISVDGMRPDAVDVLGPDGAPNFHRMRKEGSFTGNARTDFTYTVTLPNHTCMITGRGVVGPLGHGWISNSDPNPGENLHRNREAYVASVFDVVHDHGLSTALYASKSKFSLYDLSYDEKLGAPDETGEDNGKDKIDRSVIDEDSAKLVDTLVAQLEEGGADFTMLHLRDCDSTGHKDGWELTPGSPYLKTLAEVDGLIGKIIDTIKASPDLEESIRIVLTADHGGLTGTKGHGEANERDNYTIPFYTWGAGIPAGGDLYSLSEGRRKDPGTENVAYELPGQPIRNGDAANFILSILRLPAVPGSTINVMQDLMNLPAD